MRCRCNKELNLAVNSFGYLRGCGCGMVWKYDPSNSNKIGFRLIIDSIMIHYNCPSPLPANLKAIIDLKKDNLSVEEAVIKLKKLICIG